MSVTSDSPDLVPPEEKATSIAPVVISSTKESKSVYSSSLPIKKYTGLCVGVGGVKGVLQAGALHEFWTRGQLENLTHYAGSSAGSMIASLLAIGYEPIDLLTSQCAPNFTSQFGSLNFMNLPNIYGFFPSSTIKNKLEELYMLKLGYLPTFANLKDKMGKHLIVAVYCLSEPDINNKKVYCSPETTPEMLISDAVILSCSIPIIFQKAVYQGKVYVDGAYTSTFPIKALYDSMPSGADILGIMLEAEAGSMDTFLGFVTSIMLIPLDQDNLSNLPPGTDVIEVLDLKGTSAINFNLTSTQKMDLFSSGTKQVRSMMERASSMKSSIDVDK